MCEEQMDYKKAYKEEVEVSKVLYKMIDILNNYNTNSIDLSTYTFSIYGVGMIGERLFSLLRRYNANIEFVIDSNKCIDSWNGLKVYHADDNIPNVDYVIISSLKNYNEIRDNLNKMGISNILSIDVVLNEIKNNPVKFR